MHVLCVYIERERQKAKKERGMHQSEFGMAKPEEIISFSLYYYYCLSYDLQV